MLSRVALSGCGGLEGVDVADPWVEVAAAYVLEAGVAGIPPKRGGIPYEEW
jgi:hypothetical protein